MSVPILDGAVTAVYPLVVHLAAVLEPVGGAVAAVVICTAVLRLLMLPLTRSAVRGERARQVLAPQVSDLSRRYRGDPARLQRELAAVYQSAGVSPLAGCLPLLAQSPFLMIWYRIFTTPRISGRPNVLLSHHVLGCDLSARLVDGGHPLAFVPLVAALIVLSLLSIWRARRVALATGNEPPRGVLSALPMLSPLSALVMPLVAVVYLVTTMTWTLVENIALRRGLPAVRT